MATVDVLLVMGGKEEWLRTPRPPDLGDNLGSFGFPDWYADEHIEQRGRIALLCRREAMRSWPVADTGGDEVPDELAEPDRP